MLSVHDTACWRCSVLSPKQTACCPAVYELKRVFSPSCIESMVLSLADHGWYRIYQPKLTVMVLCAVLVPKRVLPPTWLLSARWRSTTSRTCSRSLSSCWSLTPRWEYSGRGSWIDLPTASPLCLGEVVWNGLRRCHNFNFSYTNSCHERDITLNTASLSADAHRTHHPISAVSVQCVLYTHCSGFRVHLR